MKVKCFGQNKILFATCAFNTAIAFSFKQRTYLPTYKRVHYKHESSVKLLMKQYKEGREKSILKIKIDFCI